MAGSDDVTEGSLSFAGSQFFCVLGARFASGISTKDRSVSVTPVTWKLELFSLIHFLHYGQGRQITLDNWLPSPVVCRTGHHSRHRQILLLSLDPKFNGLRNRGILSTSTSILHVQNYGQPHQASRFPNRDFSALSTRPTLSPVYLLGYMAPSCIMMNLMLARLVQRKP